MKTKMHDSIDSYDEKRHIESKTEDKKESSFLDMIADIDDVIVDTTTAILD